MNLNESKSIDLRQNQGQIAQDNKGIAPIIIVIIVGILAIGISGGAFWYWGQNQKKIEDYQNQTKDLQNQLTEAKKKIEELEEKSSTSEESSGGLGTTTIDETKNWQTYTGSDYSIKYPNDWKANSEKTYGNVDFVSPQREADLAAKKIVRVFDLSIKIYNNVSSLPDNDSILGFDDWIKKEEKSGLLKNVNSKTLSGAIGYEGIAVGDGEIYIIYIQKNNKIYTIELSDKTKPGAIESKMINSFKFTK